MIGDGCPLWEISEGRAGGSRRSSRVTQSSLYSVVASSIAEVARDLGIYDSTLGELGAQPRTEREPGVDTPTPRGIRSGPAEL